MSSYFERELQKHTKKVHRKRESLSVEKMRATDEMLAGKLAQNRRLLNMGAEMSSSNIAAGLPVRRRR